MYKIIIDRLIGIFYKMNMLTFLFVFLFNLSPLLYNFEHLSALFVVVDESDFRVAFLWYDISLWFELILLQFHLNCFSFYVSLYPCD